MSVEIKIGDTIEFKNIHCHSLLYKIFGESEFSLREIPVNTSILAKVTSIHKTDTFENGYVILEDDNNQVYIVHVQELLNSKFTILNSKNIFDTVDYPNKWAEFVDDDNRKVPKTLDDVMYGRTAIPTYKKLIKKYVPTKRRLYLWVCNMCRNLVG